MSRWLKAVHLTCFIALVLSVTQPAAAGFRETARELKPKLDNYEQVKQDLLAGQETVVVPGIHEALTEYHRTLAAHPFEIGNLSYLDASLHKHLNPQQTLSRLFGTLHDAADVYTLPGHVSAGMLDGLIARTAGKSAVALELSDPQVAAATLSGATRHRDFMASYRRGTEAFQAELYRMGAYRAPQYQTGFDAVVARHQFYGGDNNPWKELDRKAGIFKGILDLVPVKNLQGEALKFVGG